MKKKPDILDVNAQALIAFGIIVIAFVLTLILIRLF